MGRVEKKSYLQVPIQKLDFQQIIYCKKCGEKNLFKLQKTVFGQNYHKYSGRTELNLSQVWRSYKSQVSKFDLHYLIMPH